jgi:hypothetical protein
MLGRGRGNAILALGIEGVAGVVRGAVLAIRENQ